MDEKKEERMWIPCHNGKEMVVLSTTSMTKSKPSPQVAVSLC